MRCAARATEAIQYNAILLCSMLDEARYEISMLGREKHTRSPEHCRGLLFTIGIVGENALAHIGFHFVQHSLQSGNLLLIRPPRYAAITIKRHEAAFVG